MKTPFAAFLFIWDTIAANEMDTEICWSYLLQFLFFVCFCLKYEPKIENYSSHLAIIYKPKNKSPH